MLRNKIQNSTTRRVPRSAIKIQKYNLKFKILDFGLSVFCILIFGFWISLYAQEQFTYDAKGKRDPFIPLVTPDGRLLKLEQEEIIKGILLEGIIYDKYGVSYAIVNGGVVSVGDTIGDYQVLKIQENKVIFVKEGELQEIELKKEEE